MRGSSDGSSRAGGGSGSLGSSSSSISSICCRHGSIAATTGESCHLGSPLFSVELHGFCIQGRERSQLTNDCSGQHALQTALDVVGQTKHKRCVCVGHLLDGIIITNCIGCDYCDVEVVQEGDVEGGV